MDNKTCNECIFAHFPKRKKNSAGDCEEQPGNGMMAVWIAPRSKACSKFKAKVG